MIEVAETLAEEFDFVRVDLYLPNERDVIFGEIYFRSPRRTARIHSSPL